MSQLPTSPSGRVRFPNLNHMAYQHPSDLQAIEAIKKVPLASKLMRKVSEHWFEKWFYVRSIGDNLRLGPRQCPRVYNLFVEAASILDMPVPEIYLDTSYEINAFAFGMHKYTVTVNSGLIDLLEEEELLAVIGHELSHIKCEHMLYKSMSEILGRVGAEVFGNLLGLGNLLSLPLLAALSLWSRKAELSCDRAGLLVTQNPTAVASALVKLGGMTSPRWRDEIDMEEVIRQATDYESLDDSILLKGMMIYSSWTRSHPYPIYRSKVIQDWAASEEYHKILSGQYITHAQAAQIRLEGPSAPSAGWCWPRGRTSARVAGGRWPSTPVPVPSATCRWIPVGSSAPPAASPRRVTPPRMSCPPCPMGPTPGRAGSSAAAAAAPSPPGRLSARSAASASSPFRRHPRRPHPRNSRQAGNRGWDHALIFNAKSATGTISTED